ncbi:MAG: hypothetical protein WCO33_03590 [bacterium]
MTANLQIGTPVLIIIAVIFLLLVGLVIYFFIKLNKKINDLGKPKFGFLGKPLTYSVMAIMLGMGAVVFVGYNLGNINNGDNRTNANNSIKVDYQQFNLDSPVKDKKRIELTAVVLEDGIVWGKNTYNLTWTFVGKQNTLAPIIETNRGQNAPSFVVVDLSKDVYEISVKAQNGSTVVSTTKEIDLR